VYYLLGVPNLVQVCSIGFTSQFSLLMSYWLHPIFLTWVCSDVPNLVQLCYSIDCAPQSSSSLAKQKEIPSYNRFTCKIWRNTTKEPPTILGIWISQLCILLGVPDLDQLCRNFVCASRSLSLVRNGGTQRKSLQLYWGFGFLTCVLLGVPDFVQLCRNIVCASHLLLDQVPSRKKCHHSISFTCKKWRNTKKKPPILLRIWIIIASHIHHERTDLSFWDITVEIVL
jgi:hypothetical protein